MGSTETMTYQDALSSQYLSSSLSNLSRSRSTNSLIVRTYKQATQLYLTKRFKEAWDTLEPLVKTQDQGQEDNQVDGVTDHPETALRAAPIAQSSKGTRTKVWVFYLSLLHAIIDLGPEEGKLQFGSNLWRQISSKARDGSVWDEIVQNGYDGSEGSVDSDVVVNLATLLLSHMPSQRFNQQHLESWLAANATMQNGGAVGFANGTMSPSANGSSTPKELATRLKILELYALHVLPANEEMAYAKEFIEMDDTLDDERKDAFLHALQQLKEEKDGTAQKERELAARREQEMEEQRRAEAARRAEEAAVNDERRIAAEVERQQTVSGHTASADLSDEHKKPGANGHVTQTHQSNSRPARPQKKPPSPPPSDVNNLYRRASGALNNLQKMILRASHQLTEGNPAIVLRFLIFLAAFVIMFARRDLRMKIKRALEDGWIKVKKTVGMGVKVSYI